MGCGDLTHHDVDPLCGGAFALHLEATGGPVVLGGGGRGFGAIGAPGGQVEGVEAKPDGAQDHQAGDDREQGENQGDDHAAAIGERTPGAEDLNHQASFRLEGPSPASRTTRPRGMARSGQRTAMQRVLSNQALLTASPWLPPRTRYLVSFSPA